MERLFLQLTVVSLICAAQADDPRTRPGAAAGPTAQEGLNSKSSDAPYANRAAVVALAIIGVVCIFSLFVSITGIVVAQQYPRPHCLCWQRYRSDVAGSGCRCSLYRSNVGLAMVWILFSTIMAITRTLPSLAVCIGVTLLHLLAIYMLRKAFNRHGYPSWSPQSVMIHSIQQAGQNQGSTPHAAPSQLQMVVTQQPQPTSHMAAGVPIINIPLLRAEVGVVNPQAERCKCRACQQFELLDLRDVQAAAVHADMAVPSSYTTHTEGSYGQTAPGYSTGMLGTDGIHVTGIGRFHHSNLDVAHQSGNSTDQHHLRQVNTSGSSRNSAGAAAHELGNNQGDPVIAHPVHESLLLVSGTPVGLQPRVLHDSGTNNGQPEQFQAASQGSSQGHAAGRGGGHQAAGSSQAAEGSREVRQQLSRTFGRHALPPGL